MEQRASCETFRSTPSSFSSPWRNSPRQKPFAEKLEISQTTLSLLVNNRSLPTLEMAYRISEELNLSVHDIWIKEIEQP
ncbi:helix-turn-helix transcriptional regulator [Cohnella kolymensis]|uniref:helix-turn-helix transcriptional regulator n=1 Tax=Cohnella kolymensis TaxID=1590652 RepID=UPI0009E3688C